MSFYTDKNNIGACLYIDNRLKTVIPLLFNAYMFSVASEGLNT